MRKHQSAGAPTFQDFCGLVAPPSVQGVDAKPRASRGLGAEAHARGGCTSPGSPPTSCGSCTPGRQDSARLSDANHPCQATNQPTNQPNPTNQDMHKTGERDLLKKLRFFSTSTACSVFLHVFALVEDPSSQKNPAPRGKPPCFPGQSPAVAPSFAIHPQHLTFLCLRTPE